jgi:hypothetical protein
VVLVYVSRPRRHALDLVSIVPVAVPRGEAEALNTENFLGVVLYILCLGIPQDLAIPLTQRQGLGPISTI